MPENKDIAKGNRVWRLGLIGCGRFGEFCLESLSGEERIRPTAVTDCASAAAESLAGRFAVTAYKAPEEMFARDDLDLVLISTPPNTHYSLAKKALGAGKHVVVEKPLALRLEEADELLEAARSAGCLLAVNHMLRYSPILAMAKKIIESGILGRPLCFRFDNFAEDERLPADHWFWDEARSGGIFVEHGVHFFDLYRWWFGKMEVLASHRETRQETKQVDRVWCALRSKEGILGQHYHSFDQPVRLDRAFHNVVFERGAISICGWIPMEIKVSGIVSEEEHARLVRIEPKFAIRKLEQYEGARKFCRGRGNDYKVDAKIEVEYKLKEDKGVIYGAMIRALLEDQLRSLEDDGHKALVKAADARAALVMALEARQKARGE